MRRASGILFRGPFSFAALLLVGTLIISLLALPGVEGIKLVEQVRQARHQKLCECGS